MAIRYRRDADAAAATGNRITGDGATARSLQASVEAVAWPVSAPAAHITGRCIALDGDRGWS